MASHRTSVEGTLLVSSILRSLDMQSVTAAEWKHEFSNLVFTAIPNASEHPLFNYSGFEPGKTVLAKGHVKAPGRKPFTSEVIYERDTGIQMRDGIRIFADIFRSITSDKNPVPALMPWSAYGKTGTGVQQYESMGPFSCGVPLGKTSGYEKFEAPDPAEWCERGYAIINVDARGAGMSEGDIHFWGIQEAEDVFDTIDWVSKQPWCNGSVGMVGNSWLAISQINFASRLHHPALKALAPMEALNDPYRQLVTRGGKPHNMSFHKLLIDGMAGPNSIENMFAMLAQRPLYDNYWQSKYIKTEEIDIPLYLLASYSSGLHTAGSFHTFQTAKTKHKWLRVHPYQEWFDLYRPEVNDELQRYFDRFCKGIDNGWERDIPPLRLSLLGFEGSAVATVIERPENEYPLARQQLEKYYLDPSERKLVRQLPGNTSAVSHEAHNLTTTSVSLNPSQFMNLRE
ncbi:hypothetical protein LTR84_011951 [Exophiala bonariae]|uniref:Xaa-Pro dipeptidyl-peptidase-like domain-containing protein n=1 Tax=Exophiala bonariae TaxID=1690606 RepID=A0AAV9MU60_9EURO|nr:hypothetical protein LTR84_011951 [Exophiala bonariae]